MNDVLVSPRFPRASRYHPDWIAAGISGGAHALWLTEWLSEALPLTPGMRVLDLGCGRALSSIFLHREFGVQVWAADLWFDPAENLQRIRDAEAARDVFPLRADARHLPFAAAFFDAIVCIDAYMYFGTDDLFLPTIARLLKPGGRLGVAMSGLTAEFDGDVPAHLAAWWSPEMYCLHSADWWRRHWQRAGVVEVERADMLENGWRAWLDWQRFASPDNALEIDAITADRGRHMAYVRAVARRNDVAIAEPIVSLPPHYEARPLLRVTEA